MNSKLSYGYLNLRLARHALETISQTKPSASLILDYLDRKKYMINALDNITTVEEGNNVRKVILNLSDESLKLMQTLQPELREYEDKFTVGNLEEMVCLYILLNVDLLLSDELMPILHSKLYFLTVTSMYPLKTRLALALRIIKIANDLLLSQITLEKMNNFLSLLSPNLYQDIVYSVYYGIYDGRPVKCIDEFTNFDKVDMALLDSGDNLPDSIIKEFFISEQLDGVPVHFIQTIIMEFFTSIENTSNINSKYIAQRLFENDFNNLNSNAKLLNIRNLINEHGLYIFEFEYYLYMIKNGEYILPLYQKGGLKNGNI